MSAVYMSTYSSVAEAVAMGMQHWLSGAGCSVAGEVVVASDLGVAHLVEQIT